MSFRTILARTGTAANAASTTSFRSSFSMANSISSPSGLRMLSSQAEKIRPLKSDEADDVVFESKYGVRTILLNRPKKLNSLNASMIRKIVPRLIEWENSDMANVVIMKGAGEKALCAGGDVAALAKFNQDGKDGWKKSANYFALEYQLDHYIATYKKPYISFMDGITMGGGVGLSIHAPFRIATEKTVFAMPETTIGFFPDVGASFFLPRMNGAIGTYLALTSDRLTGPNVFTSGIATHYLHSTSLPELEARLAEVRFRDSDDLKARLNIINSTIEEFVTGLPHNVSMHPSGEIRQAVDRCFSKGTVNEIIAALGEERGATEEWAQKQLQTLQKRSPTAVHVTLRQMQTGGQWDIAEAFQKEFRIASQFMQHPDFTEGVTALLVRKETPKWQYSSLEEITSSEDVTNPFFDFEDSKPLELFTNETYQKYPSQHLGVPTEADVKDLLSQQRFTQNELVRQATASRQNRQGIVEVVREIVGRKTEVGADGKAKWIEDEAVGSKL